MSHPRAAYTSALALTLATVAASPSSAQQAEPGLTVEQKLADMEAREQRALNKISELEQRLRLLEERLVGDGEQAGMRGRGATSALRAVRYGDTVAALETGQPAADDQTAARTEEDRKAPAPTEAIEAIARQRQGEFGDRFGIEVGLAYTHFNNARINLNGFLALDAIFLGQISIDQIRADILTADVTARYGFNDRLQADVAVPYLFRQSTFQSGGAGGSASGVAEKKTSGSGLGDISFGASYRIMKEAQRRPDVVLSVRAKAPTGRHPFGIELVEVPGTEGNLAYPEKLSTGTGVWGVSAGASVLKTLDPLVVFGSLTYFYNFAKNFDDLDEAPDDQPGRAKIGSAIQYGAGVAFALNEKSSLSMSFTQRLVGHSKIRREGQSWQRVVGSQANVGLVNLGGTFALSERATLISTVGIGLTQDSPNMVVSVRVPYRF